LGATSRSSIFSSWAFEHRSGNEELMKCQHRDHVKELNNQRPKQPFFFLKPPSSILLPGAGPVIRPKGVDLHYEVELALIMGKQVKDLDPGDEKGALEAIESILYPNTSC
jgi:hypothetical protein